ncbi:MFS transporter [Lasiosphaeria hispida]|uniref:MFS transporter n=1 Tax=Lasiosphaeria hispida TaxID=260671 RepID=A0AAJ0MCZ9_9PEZI|nr:MFS transporter [Lasiosphaeria hispida]
MAPAKPATGEATNARPSTEIDNIENKTTGQENVVVAQNDSTLQGLKLAAVTTGVCFGALMMSLDISIIGTAIPSIMSEFGDTSQIAWYPAAFTFAVCSLTPLAGKMAAVFPLHLVYMSFSAIFLVGSIVCGCAPTSNAFIAGRAISGVGAAGVASNGMTILLTIAPPRRKPVLMGAGAGCFALGLVIAPVLGGALTERVTWRWCFWINLPFITITIATIFLFYKPTKADRRSVMARILGLDLVGCAVFVPAIFMLLLALQTGGERNSWDSATVIGLFVGFGVLAAVFVAWQWRKGDGAMIPGNVAMRPTVIFIGMFAFCHMGSLTIAGFYLPEWFQVVEGVNPLESGVRMLPTVITQIIATIFASSLALRIKYYNPWFFLAPLFMCTAGALYTQFKAFSTPPSHWIGFQVIQGIGAGFGMQMSSLSVQLELKDSPEIVPVGIALVMLFQYLGATVVQVIAGAIFNGELKDQLASHVGLTGPEMEFLLDGGVRNVREVTEQHFPELLTPILEAYNSAITRVFFVPVAGAGAALIFACGIKWNRIEGGRKSETKLEAIEGAEGAESAEAAETVEVASKARGEVDKAGSNP